ncbi:hypothetical protein B0H13DRAFT_1907245 [Mycena leptocephala]|nr:hypothetical protein B0H13DRAFT_1907245 [Mycena leptocephala]
MPIGWPRRPCEVKYGHGCVKEKEPSVRLEDLPEGRLHNLVNNAPSGFKGEVTTAEAAANPDFPRRSTDKARTRIPSLRGFCTFVTAAERLGRDVTMYSVGAQSTRIPHSPSVNEPICTSKLPPPTVGIKNPAKNPPEVQETGMSATVEVKTKRKGAPDVEKGRQLEGKSQSG